MTETEEKITPSEIEDFLKPMSDAELEVMAVLACRELSRRWLEPRETAREYVNASDQAQVAVEVTVKPILRFAMSLVEADGTRYPLKVHEPALAARGATKH